MKIVSVIPLKKGVFTEELTYFTSQKISLGNIVTISIRNKKILGLVVFIENAINIKSNIKDMDFNLKKLIEIKKESIFKSELIESIFLISKYFILKKNIVFTRLIPSVLKEKYDEISNVYQNKSYKGKKGNKNIKSKKSLFQASIEDRILYYKTLINESLIQKKSIFFVLPTEYDISFFFKKLSIGNENSCILIHGNLSTKKQLENIKKIINTKDSVIVFGTAPFLSIPRYDFKIIILEHESSNAYKTIIKPNIDLKIYTEIFATKINAEFILADSLLSFETIARKELDNLSEIYPLSFKINFEGKIEIPKKETVGVILDKKKKFQVLTEKNIKEIKNTITKKENVLIFSLRKGLASITICKDCNQEILCNECTAPLVLYLSKQNNRIFFCNRCKEETSTEIKCKNCAGWNLMPFGIGTDTVYEECKIKFPNTKIFKLDKESAKNKNEAEKIIKEFEEEKGNILVATEMALLYLKEKLSLSVVASLDSLYSIPNYKINEKIIQIITQIISKTEKKLIIQTKNPENPTILAIKTKNLRLFINEELKDRQNLSYPPYETFIKITSLDNKEGIIKTKQTFSEVFKEYKPIILNGFIVKQKEKYRTNALIKINRNMWSLPELLNNSYINQNLFQKLSSLPQSFSITINPEDML